jgi:hypothetical protein
VPAGPRKGGVLRDLHNCLLEARRSQYAEIWVDHGAYPCRPAVYNTHRPLTSRSNPHSQAVGGAVPFNRVLAACSAAIPVRCKWLIPMAAEQAA